MDKEAGGGGKSKNRGGVHEHSTHCNENESNQQHATIDRSDSTKYTSPLLGIIMYMERAAKIYNHLNIYIMTEECKRHAYD